MKQDASNAVQQALSRLTDQWNEFKMNSDPSILVWTVSQTDATIINTFLSVEEEEDAASTLDIFIPLRAEFEDQEQHGAALVKDIDDAYESARSSLADAGFTANWKRPDRRPEWTGIQWFGKVCAHFAKHHETESHVEEASSQQQPIFVFVLHPQNHQDVNAWCDTLNTLANLTIPKNVRFLAIASDKSDIPSAFFEQQSDKIVVRDPQVSASELNRQLVRSSGGIGPGYQFKVMFVDLTNLATDSDLSKRAELETFQSTAKAAIELTKAHQLDQQAFAVHMLVANALVGANRHKESLDAYRCAVDTAERIAISDSATGCMLKVQALMGRASLHIEAQDYNSAAQVYDQAATAACQAEERCKPLLEVEARRMEAYCYSKLKDMHRAWNTYYQALDTGERFTPDGRADSTIPMVGEGLMELVHPPRKKGLRGIFAAQTSFKDRESEVLDRMKSLLGETWQPTRTGLAG